MSFSSGRSVLVSTRESRENKKSTQLNHFSTSKNDSNEVFTLKINKSFCLRSHGIRQPRPHFMNFQCIDVVKRGIVKYIDIEFCETPTHMLHLSRQTIEYN
jgi:hypothetical protein